MYRFTHIFFLAMILYFSISIFAQPPEFDQLPPDSSAASMSTVTTEAEQENRTQTINTRYQQEYKQFIAKQDSVIIDIESKAGKVKIIYIIAWLLPAIGALINFINKKAVQITVSILVGLGVILSNFGTMLYHSDERGFLATASGVKKIVNGFKYKFKGCLDSDDYFINESIRNEFNAQLQAVEDAILAETVKTREEKKSADSEGPHSAIDEKKYSILPMAYAKQPVLFPHLMEVCISPIDSAKALVVSKTEELVYKGKRYSLSGLRNQIPIDKEYLAFVGIGADADYIISKDKAGVSLRENLESIVLDGINVQGTIKDSIALINVAKQCSAIILESGLPVFESFYRADEYIYVIVQSVPVDRVDKLLKRVANDKGLAVKSITLNKEKFLSQDILYPQIIGPQIDEQAHAGKDIKIIHSVSFKTKSNNVNWYDFSVHIEADPKVLQVIKKVTYNMHPTFRKPHMTVNNKAEKFKYSWVGWGVFRMSADIYFIDGTEKRIDHQLTF